MSLAVLRSIIGLLDRLLFWALGRRMAAAAAVGRAKKRRGLEARQPQQWAAVQERGRRLGRAAGLSRRFVEGYLDQVHAEALRRQR